MKHILSISYRCLILFVFVFTRLFSLSIHSFIHSTNYFLKKKREKIMKKLVEYWEKNAMLEWK